MIIPIKALVIVYFTKAFIVCFYSSANAQSPLAALLFVIKLIFLQVNIKIPLKERTIDTAKTVFNRDIFHDRNKMIRKVLSTYL